MLKAELVFYEKPGCINNTRQKKILKEAGFELDVRNLITTSWNKETLQEFFRNLPKKEWFNPSAPAIKSKQVIPEKLSEQEALEEMTKDPLLIRRPLMQFQDYQVAGFNLEKLVEVVQGKGVTLVGMTRAVPDDIEQCPTNKST